MTGRLSDTAQNALCNIVTIMLGTTVGATANGEIFLRVQTIAIICMGLLAFAFATVGGVLFGKAPLRADRRKDQPADRFRRRIRKFPWQPVYPRPSEPKKTRPTSF